MTIIGVNIAIFQNDRLLFTLREDFEVWCLPGGAVDPGESVAQAATREAREETGLDVRLTRLVGMYSRPGKGNFVSHVFLFAAEPLGGNLTPQPGETIDLRFFTRNTLPADRMALQDLRIAHAWDGRGGSVAYYQDQAWPFLPCFTRAELYALRDRSELPYEAFYRLYLSKSGPCGDFREVPPQSWPLPYHSAERDPALARDAGDPDTAANIAVIQDGKILLSKREDFHVWCIPGGMVEPGETLAEAACRELREETGLEITLERLVGIYSEPARFQRGLHVVLFSGRIAGGVLRPQAEEVLQLQFFGLSELPADLLYGHHQRILDAFGGIGGSVAWTQNLPWPFEPAFSRADIYALRDRSGLSRRGFYQQYFRPPQPGNEVDDLDSEPTID